MQKLIPTLIQFVVIVIGVVNMVIDDKKPLLRFITYLLGAIALSFSVYVQLNM